MIVCRQMVVVVVAVPKCATQRGGATGASGLVRDIVEGLSDCHLAVVGYGMTITQNILRWVWILKNIKRQKQHQSKEHNAFPQGQLLKVFTPLPQI